MKFIIQPILLFQYYLQLIIKLDEQVSKVKREM